MKLSHIAAVLLGASTLTLSASADEPPGLIMIYNASDFSAFAPRTALDMISRVPGFSLDDGDSTSRGLGQASGNVLINGQRVSGKSNTASDALSRIPAANVVQLELLEGAALDIPGLTGQVLNVVTEADAISGAWTWRSRFRENLPPFYNNVELSALGSLGDLSWNASLVSSPGRGSNKGREDVFDGDGDLTAYRAEEYNFTADHLSGALALKWRPGNGHIANINGEYAIWESDQHEYSTTFTPEDELFSFRNYAQSEDQIEYEFSGDYEFGFGPGRLKLIGLNRFEDSPFNTTVRLNVIDEDGQSARRYRQTAIESESILRSEYSWAVGRNDLQVSLEGAFNYLDNSAIWMIPNDDGAFELQPGSEYAVRVEEKRSEGFVSWARPLTPKLAFQSSLGVEYSEISQPGGNVPSQSFVRPKGEIALSYSATQNIDVATRLSRKVGQLDFYDFVSSVNLNQNNENNGNPDVVPQQSWYLEMETQAELGRYGAGTFRLYGEAIDDVIVQVPILVETTDDDGVTTTRFREGPGNIDSAWRYGFELDATLKLEAFGFKGAELTINAQMADSEVDDPLTGEPRRLSEDLIDSFEMSFRHDIPQTDWAWGLEANGKRTSPAYRLDQISWYRATPAYVYGFIEHKNLLGMTGTAFFGNYFDQDEKYRRAVYTADRTENLTLVEDRTRNIGPSLTLRLKGSF